MLALLTVEADQNLVEDWLSQSPTRPWQDLVIHDVDNALSDRTIFGRNLRRLGPDARLLNDATIVIDLSLDEDLLFKQMASSCRGKIRAALADGVEIEAHSRPTECQLQRYLRALDRLAVQRRFARPLPSVTRRMFEDGNSVLFVAKKGGAELTFVQIYLAEDVGYWLAGVDVDRSARGAGDLIHWAVIRNLRQQGYNWYDMGGVRVSEPPDTIFQFKRKFGGTVVTLGTEWQEEGWLFRVATAGRRLLAAGAHSDLTQRLKVSMERRFHALRANRAR